MSIVMDKSKQDSGKESAVKKKRRKWDLFLYVAGKNKKTTTALRNLKVICEDQLKGKYHVQVVDLIKKPHLARMNQILAVPTLVRVSPLPIRSIIGDLSNTERVMVGLDLLDGNTIQRM